jgi:O-antigen ligase
MERALPTSPDLATRLAHRYSRSSWRLLAVAAGVLVVFFVPLYLLRGMRLVQLGALGLLGLGIALAGFSRPFPALLAALFLYHSGLDYFVPGPAGGFLLLLALARIGFDALGGMHFETGTRAFRLSLAVLLAVVLSSLLVVTDWGLAQGELGKIGTGLALFVAISNLANHPRRLVAVITTYAAAVAVNGMMPIGGSFVAGGPTAVAIAFANRVGGLGTDTNVHAGDVNCVLPILLVAATRVHGWRRWALGALVPLLIVSLIATQSRAGLLIFCIVLLGTLARLGPRGRVLAVLAFGALAVVATSLPDFYWERFRSITQLQGIVVDRSLLIRQHILSSGWDIFVTHPWLGVGLGNLRVHASHYMLDSIVAHNAYLELAGSLGIFGLLAWLAWVASGFGMLRQARTRWRHSIDPSLGLVAEGLWLALLAFCVTALTLSIEFHYTLFMLLALANAARLAAQATPAVAPA